MAATTADGLSRRRSSKKAPECSSADDIDVKRRVPLRPHLRAPAKTAHRSLAHQSGASDAAKHDVARRPRGRSGNGPTEVESPLHVTSGADESDGVDDEGSVEEYDFTAEPSDDDDAPENDMDDDADSAITVSSDPPAAPESEYAINKRPWLTFPEDIRKQWEIMYSNVTPYPVASSWVATEEYQREKDNEMLRYMEDFPLSQWVIPQQQASNAYNQLVERIRWRNYGIPIYGRDRVPATPNAPAAPLPPPPVQGLCPPPPGLGPGQLHPHSLYSPQPYPSAPPRQILPLHMPQHAVQQPMQNAMPVQMPSPQQQQQQQQHHIGLAPHPNRGQLPPNLVAVPSQPYAQPMPMHHGPTHPGMGYAIGPPQQISYGIPLGTYMGKHMPSGGMYTSQGPAPPRQPRKPREKKETPAVGTPPLPPPTPPYENRVKPVSAQKAAKKPAKAIGSKSGRRSQRRPAEADDFPWTRKLNFREAKENATWDDSIYSHETLVAMQAAREHNAKLIDSVDSKLGEAQRQARSKKKGALAEEDVSKASLEVEAKPRERKKRGHNNTYNNDAGDPNHSASYSWADESAAKVGRAMGYEIPDEAIYQGMEGRLSEEQMAMLRVVWNPSKKGGPDNLRPAVFSVKDSVLTRKQLEKTPILTQRAAECLVDFCPEMLWRGTLLRVTSEGGFGNKDVRDRFCRNGSYCDKATITKRISAALGQKQVQPKSKGYQEGEYEWYEQNVKDFTNYISYFGRRTGHRNMLKIQMQGDRRKAKLEANARERDRTSPEEKKEEGEEEGEGKGEEGEGEGRKRRKLDVRGAYSSEAAPTSDGNDGGGEESDGESAEEEEEADRDGDDDDEDDDDNSDDDEDGDAVSAQDSDILDELDNSD